MNYKAILIALIFTMGTVFSQTSKKVIGYYPSYRFSNYLQIEYCKLTHLNLCFANPDASGNLIFPDFTVVRNKALLDNLNIKIFISLGGGDAQQAIIWSNLIDVPSNRPAFIQKIVNFVLTNNLDGVDVDLEWDFVTSGYSGFVVELKQALTAQNKLLSVALPNNTRYSNLNDAALASFDFINIMAYDATGSWDPNHPGQHSSVAFAQNGINFWKNTIGVAANKLTLGVPFYGYEFVNSTVNAKTFSEIISMNPANAQLDNVGNIYYNGIPTIRAKAEMVKNQVSGIMIWELGQDSYNEYSLLATIHDKFTNLGVTTTGLCGNESTLDVKSFGYSDFEITPNPTSDYINIKVPVSCKMELFNYLGQKIAEANLEPYYVRNEISTNSFHSGIFFAKFTDSNSKSLKTIKIIKN